MGAFIRDLQFATRVLKKDLRFTFLSILALALGIGSTVLIFSVVDNLMVQPWPYANADRYTTFSIHGLDGGSGDDIGAFPVQEFLAFQQQNHVFEDVIGAQPVGIHYTGSEEAELFPGVIVSANTFRVLGVRPLFGRPITAADGAPGAPPVFVISYRLWMQQFKGDPKILGTVLDLNGEPTTLVGIMPPRFTYVGGSLWLPLQAKSGEQHNLFCLGVRKPGVSLKQAAADLEVTARGLSKLYPREYPQRFTVLTSDYTSAMLGPFKSLLYLLFGAVAMLLLIACGNVGNLLLARTTAREKEIAIRFSLGATRIQIVRQLLIEGLVLATAGAALGWLFAYGGLKAAIPLIPPDTLPREAVISLNYVVAAFAVAVTFLTTLLCSLAPAIYVVRGKLRAGLGGRIGGWNRTLRQGRLQAGLVIGQVALSIVLFAGAGLMARTFMAFEHVDLGYNPQNVFYAALLFPAGYTANQKQALLQTVLKQVSAYPGVIAATAANSLPLSDEQVSQAFVPGDNHSERRDVTLESCSEGYFKTLETKLIRGRLLSESDIDSSRHVAVINQSFSRKLFGAHDPIGRTVEFTAFDQRPQSPHRAYFEIIGIIADIRNLSLTNSPMPQAFLPYTVSPLGGGVRILVRTAKSSDAMGTVLRRKVWTIQRSVAVAYTGTLETRLEDDWFAQPRFGLFTLGTFAGIGLVLVVIGVFSLTAYSVSLRTYEIGVRMALGARPGTVLKMVLLDGFGMIATGTALGLLASLVFTRFIASQLWGVSARDPLTFGAVIAATVTAGLLACWLPARRAARVEPAVALRYE